MRKIHKFLLKWGRESNKLVAEYRKQISAKYYFLVLAAILVLFLFGGDLKKIIVLGILGVAASYSTIYKRYIRIPSAIELVTIGTVITSIAYGPWIGALFGLITTFASEIISAAVDIFTFVYAFARTIIGIVSGFLYWNYVGEGGSLVFLGVGMVLLFNLIAQPIYLLPGDVETRMKAIYFFIISIAWNFIIFLVLGDILLRIVL